MAARYVAQLILSPGGGIVVAGTQGLTIVDCEVTNTGSSSVSLTMGRNAIFTGTLPAIPPLREGDVSSLSTAGVPASVTGFPPAILQWQLAPASVGQTLRLFHDQQVYIAPGSNVLFQGSGASLNLFVEE